MIAYAWIIPGLPLLGAIGAICLRGRFTRYAGYLTSAAIFGALLVTFKLLTGVIAHPGATEISFSWLRSAGGLEIPVGMLVDPLSAVMLLVVCFVSLMVQVYSLGYMASDPGFNRYFSFLSLFTFSMLGLVLASNLVLMYMFWELVGLSSYLLIGFWYHKPEAASAAKKAFVVTRFGDLGFLIGILFIGYLLNTFSIVSLGEAVKAGKLAGHMATVIALLIFAGAVGKSAQFPLHIWLPDAMEGPTPVSALIHAATMVAAGVFLVARLFPVFAASPTALQVVAYIGGFTALFAATIACVQDDIKRVLAYSTLSQLGYMMLALGCGGYAAGMFHLVTHAAFKALLFLGAGSVIHALHTNDIWQMGGLRRRMSITAAVMLVASLALAGVFPFSGFFSKDAVLMTVFASGRMDLFAAALLTALLTSFYIFRVFFIVFAGKPATAAQAHESPPVMTMPMLLLAVLSAGLGVFAPAFAPFIQASLGAPKTVLEESERIIPFLATFMSLLGLGWAYLLYYQKAISANLLTRRFAWIYTIVRNKYYIDEVYLFLVRNVMFILAKSLAWFDRNVVDGMVNGVAWICRVSGAGISRVQLGRLQTYLMMFVAGLAVIAACMLFFNPSVLAWVK